MKSALEPLSPTRVKLTVEVGFDELQPDLAAAYRKIGQQVRVQGFRPGKVPARLLDQRVGRGYVLEEAVQEAVPRLYGEAVRENEIAVLGQPQVEVTEFADGGQLAFTAEVDVRPEVTLPDYSGLEITVDPAGVTDEEVDEQLATQRDRFAVLHGADRPAQTGDFLLLDIAATVDGEEVPGAGATGLSYEVGSGSLMPGLDEAVVGAAEGESRAFETELVQGEYAGRMAQVSVTVRSVKVKELPELDDDFAETASEFDTIAELRQDVRSRFLQVKRLQQGVQARDRVLEALLAAVDVPLPEQIVADEVKWREENLDSQLEQAGLTREAYLQSEGRTQEQLHADVQEGAASSLKAQFVLDAIVAAEQLGVTEEELTEVIVTRAQRAGVSPDEYATSVVQADQVGALMSEAVRGKALATVMERAKITDTDGVPVDLNALDDEPADEADDAVETDEAADADAAAPAEVVSDDAPVAATDAPVASADAPAPVDEAPAAAQSPADDAAAAQVPVTDAPADPPAPVQDAVTAPSAAPTPAPAPASE